MIVTVSIVPPVSIWSACPAARSWMLATLTTVSPGFAAAARLVVAGGCVFVIARSPGLRTVVFSCEKLLLAFSSSACDAAETVFVIVRG